jgi:hypothetical protein
MMKALLPITVFCALAYGMIAGPPAVAQEPETPKRPVAAETAEMEAIPESAGTAETAATGETALAEEPGTGEIELEFGETEDEELNEVAFGQNLTIEEGDVVEGDAVCIGGDLTVKGTVAGDAVCVGGNLVVTSTAVIGGDAVNVGGTADISPDATVAGEKVAVEGDVPGLKHVKWLGILGDAASDLGHRVTAAASEIVFFGFLILVALLLTIFLPKQITHIEEHLTGAFPYATLIGVITLVFFPLATIVFTVSIIGIPLVPLMILALLVCLFVGYIVMARILGRKLVGDKHVMYQIFIGLLILHGAALFGDLIALPGGILETIGGIFTGIGWVIFIGAGFIGLGAVAHSKFGKNSLADTLAAREERKKWRNESRSGATPPKPTNE